ncbi:MAG TPA: hypothetical protein VJV78_01395 [Polyangiales bacterium]|nr:hypothetical protein [Polyangiales bacterium]
MRSFLLVIGLSCSLFSACAKPTTVPAHPTSPFTDADLKLFDDGLDTVADPDALGGRWAEDWNNEMLERVRRSDLIAIVEVTTLLTDTDPEGHTTHRLVVSVEKAMKGKPPADEINLSTPSVATGFPSIDSNKGRLLHMHLLGLLKWIELPDGSVSSHFHLASSSDKVVSRVRALMEKDQPQNRTIIERRYDSSKGETGESTGDETTTTAP